MLGLFWSLSFLSYLTNIAFAAKATQSGATSAGDLDWAEHNLGGPNVSSPNSSTTVSSKSDLSSSISSSDRGPIRCFKNPPAPVPTVYPPVVIHDYLEALEKIVVGDDALSILPWTFNPGEGKTWGSNQCRITVGTSPPAARTVIASFQPVVIAHLAAKLAQECFIPGRILGGYVTFGDYGELTVVLGAFRPKFANTATS